MNEKNDPAKAGSDKLDTKIERDWEEVEARRADIGSRAGGDTRRQAILRRLGLLKHAS